MAKFVIDNAMDAALAYIADLADRLIVCAGQPASYSEATTNLGTGAGKKLGDIAITPGAGNGDMTIGNGDTSGRKLRVLAQTAIDVDVSGTADHVALVDDGASALLMVTTLSSSQAVTAGNTMETAAFDYEIPDPS